MYVQIITGGITSCNIFARFFPEASNNAMQYFWLRFINVKFDASHVRSSIKLLDVSEFSCRLFAQMFFWEATPLLEKN